ncbi:hypothetical protein BD779DRAFT_1668932 [Infundibulicybe gibba]|nr:hypothetical protein BD779DRAFT_1668932 [Infundibulicybe gibba]
MPAHDENTDYELLPPIEEAQQQKANTMGQEERSLKLEGRNGDAFAWNAALTAIAVFAGITWIVVLTNSPTSVGWFAFHPPLQTLALALFTYGILTLQPTSQPKTKAAGLVRHQIAILCLGFPAIFFGTFAVMYNKSLRGADHFTTWHGTFGIMCMLWIVLQAGLGAGSVWFGGTAFGGGAKAKAVWKYHRASGYVLFPLLLLTAHLGGGWSHWGSKNTGFFIRLIAYTIAPAVVLLSVYTRVRLSKMNFS